MTNTRNYTMITQNFIMMPFACKYVSLYTPLYPL